MLRRAIEDTGKKEVEVNLDAANAVMCGMVIPEETVEQLGEYVINTRIKDGLPPGEEGNNNP